VLSSSLLGCASKKIRSILLNGSVSSRSTSWATWRKHKFFASNEEAYLMICFSFGGGFEMMKDGDQGNILHLIEKGTQSTSMTGHVPWLFRYLSKLPKFGNSKFRDFAIKRADLRRKQGSLRKDLFHYIVSIVISFQTTPNKHCSLMRLVLSPNRPFSMKRLAMEFWQ
jgi:hypothetical protein